MPWHRLASEHWDALFFGMGQMWRLIRQSRQTTGAPSREPSARAPATRGLDWRTKASKLPYRDAGNRELYSPYSFHRKAVRKWMARLTCLSRARGLPIVFVGSQTVDEQLLLLNPPKVDWDDFHSFGLAEVMAAVEHEAELDACRQMASRHAPAHDVYFFHPSVFAKACPGARCDGMHYASHFPFPAVDDPSKDRRGWACHRSLDLWCPFMTNFLQRYVPQLLFGPPRQCGTRREWDPANTSTHAADADAVERVRQQCFTAAAGDDAAVAR